MTPEKPKFIEGIKENAEYFLVTVSLKTGEMVTECFPKNFDTLALGKDGKDSISRKEAIEAVQRFYPEMEKPNLQEAVRMLRESKSRPKPKK